MTQWFEKRSRCERSAKEPLYHRLRVTGHSMGGSVAFLVATMSFMADDVVSDIHKGEVDAKWWREGTNRNRNTFAFYNVLLRAALGVDKLDAGVYKRIQAIALEAVPALGVKWWGNRAWHGTPGFKATQDCLGGSLDNIVATR